MAHNKKAFKARGDGGIKAADIDYVDSSCLVKSGKKQVVNFKIYKLGDRIGNTHKRKPSTIVYVNADTRNKLFLNCNKMKDFYSSFDKDIKNFDDYKKALISDLSSNNQNKKKKSKQSKTNDETDSAKSQISKLSDISSISGISDILSEKGSNNNNDNANTSQNTSPTKSPKKKRRRRNKGTKSKNKQRWLDVRFKGILNDMRTHFRWNTSYPSTYCHMFPLNEVYYRLSKRLKIGVVMFFDWLFFS